MSFLCSALNDSVLGFMSFLCSDLNDPVLGFRRKFPGFCVFRGFVGLFLSFFLSFFPCLLAWFFLSYFSDCLLRKRGSAKETREV
jgi:hypothetical protein